MIFQEGRPHLFILLGFHIYSRLHNYKSFRSTIISDYKITKPFKLSRRIRIISNIILFITTKLVPLHCDVTPHMQITTK